jgi:phage gp36-like protein
VLDSYLGNRYDVPLTGTIPARVVDLACVVARYRLHENRTPERVRQDYEDAIAFLRDVAAGRATIPGATDPSVDADDGLNTSAAAVRAPVVVFDTDVLALMP